MPPTPSNTLFDIIGLLDDETGIGNLDAALCRALATALEATEVLLLERVGRGDRLICLGAFSADSRPSPDRAEGLSGAAVMTGEVASHFEKPPSGDGANKGLLRCAVPVVAPDACPFVIEFLKTQSNPEPKESDVFLLRTIGALYALRSSKAPAPDAASPPRPFPPDATAGGSPSAAVGKSSAFDRAQILAHKAARSDCPVLILGETGTGKELVARQLHDAGRRRSKPYVTINCGALSDMVLESEFFGHVRGAFTGAYRGRKGRLEEAEGGTVFLDEVGEMTPSCQVKLLRTLDTGEITPLGGNKAVRINVRFIAATNRDLELMIQQGKFREDLFYRLQGMRIEVPPLRRRRGDAELLALFYFEREAKIQGSKTRGFSRAAMDVIKGYGWPGNIRELRQVVASAVTLAEGEWIEPGDLSQSLTPSQIPPSFAPAASKPRDDERSRLLEALRSTSYPGSGRWNVRAAARELNMNYQTLVYKVRKVHRLEHD